MGVSLSEGGVWFVDHAPRVYIVGMSMPVQAGFDKYFNYQRGNYSNVEWNTEPIEEDPLAIVEAAGRVCYKSWNNPKGSTREEYLSNSIIGHSHGSVLEHVWVNFLVADLPRSTQLELVRHGEGTGFSFESTRFTSKYRRYVVPPMVRAGNHHTLRTFKEACIQQDRDYETLSKYLASEERKANISTTLRRKRLKEASRSILPNCLGSDGMVSLNGRSLRWIIGLRTSQDADESIREFAYELFTAVMQVEQLRPLFTDASLTETVDSKVFSVDFLNPKV